MSLLQDLHDSVKILADKYHEPDMQKIIDDYCSEVVQTKQDKEIADHYVLESDKKDYLEGKILGFNDGHIFTGPMYNQRLNELFNRWYKDNYLTYEDTHDHYDEIGECIRKNTDPRLENAVISELIANGMNNYDEESVRSTFAKIDDDERKRDRRVKTDENGRRYIDNTPSKEFLKSIIRCCYKIARDFDSIQLMQYISRDLSIVYEKPVEKQFYVDDSNRVLTLTGQNNAVLMDAMYEMLSQTLSIHDEVYGFNEDFYENMVPNNCEISIENTTFSYDDVSNEESDISDNKDVLHSKDGPQLG